MNEARERREVETRVEFTGLVYNAFYLKQMEWISKR
jgi:hypothetical protein